MGWRAQMVEIFGQTDGNTRCAFSVDHLIFSHSAREAPHFAESFDTLIAVPSQDLPLISLSTLSLISLFHICILLITPPPT
jgi:hypothetical protein